jgi:hypothetical protein
MADGNDVDGFVEAYEARVREHAGDAAEAIRQVAPPDLLYLGLDRWISKGGRVP